MTFITHSAAETKKLGKVLAGILEPGDVVALQGELGAGKTTLVQGIAQGLGVRSENPAASPTFVLIHEYRGRFKIYHLDWYRLKKVGGTDAQMAEECFRGDAVTLVEWPERGEALLPPEALKVRISYEGADKRSFRFSLSPAKKKQWQKAMKG